MSISLASTARFARNGTSGKIVPKGDMSGDGRIDVSPDGKRLLLSIDMGEESGRKDWDGPLPALWSFDLESQRRRGSRRRNYSAGTAFGSITTTSSFSVKRQAKRRIQVTECPPTGKI